VGKLILSTESDNQPAPYSLKCCLLLPGEMCYLAVME